MSQTDFGAQNERTSLAWQRTALSLMAGSTVLTRLTFDRLGLFALASALVAFPLSLWALLESRRRYRHNAGTRLLPRFRIGLAPAVLTVAISVLALTELAALVISI